MDHPYAFKKFISNFMILTETGIPDRQDSIQTAINSFNNKELQVANDHIKKLLSGSYSDQELVQIWYLCEAKFCYVGKAQRIFMQEIYDTVEGVLKNKQNERSLTD